MKAIEVCPSTLMPGYAGYSPRAVKVLFDGVAVSPFLDVDFEKVQDQRQAMENMKNISISGAQEKFGLCFSSSGQPVFITKRFDVNGGVKDCSQEDFAAILQMTEEGNDSNFKYHGNYVQIADAIRKIIPAWMPQMEQFFRMVVFNYLFANEDAHMKNFSLVNRNGEYFLAPAYDLINTCAHIQSGSDMGLLGGLSPDIEKSDVYDRTGHPCRLDFERFAERIELPKKRAEMTLNMFMKIPQETYGLIDRSFLNDKMKRTYKRVIEERRVRFIRESE